MPHKRLAEALARNNNGIVLVPGETVSVLPFHHPSDVTKTFKNHLLLTQNNIQHYDTEHTITTNIPYHDTWSTISMLSTCSKTPPKKNRGQFSGRFWLQGSVKRVDFYDQGRTAVALVMIAGREQQLVCDLPGAKKRHTTHLLKGHPPKGETARH